MTDYIQRIINLEETDYWIIKQAAQEKGLGDKGFSAAVRLIIREWEAFRTGQIQVLPPLNPADQE